MTVTFYILHGSDDLRIAEEVEKLRAQMGDSPDAAMNISEFDGEIASVPEIMNAALSFPFLADKRLIIVRGLLVWLRRKGGGESAKRGLDQLVGELPGLPEWSRVVFVEQRELPAGHPVLKLAQQQDSGYARAFNAPKDSSGWIIQRARDEYDAEIEPHAAQALASVTGDDLRRADNELVKLALYVDGERPINENDVALLTPYVAEASIFAMVDAMALGQGDRALTLMQHLLEQDPRDEGFGLYGMIVRQFRLLLIAKEHLQLEGSRQGLMEALGTKSRFVADKAADQSRKFTLEQLEMIYRSLKSTTSRSRPGALRRAWRWIC